MKKISYSILLFLNILLSCGEDEEVRFNGLVLRDASGTLLGTHGSSDLNDWGMDNSLPDKIMQEMEKFPERDLTGTDYADIDIIAYPNPSADIGKVLFDLNGWGPCELKLLVVNEDFKVLWRGSLMATQNIEYNLGFTDIEKYPEGKIVRVYYAFSQKDDKYFFVGHGDFLICRSGDCL